MNGETSTHPDRATYLEEKLETLVQQVDEGYGKALLEQLIHRMEITVREFLAEIDLLVERLKDNAAAQEALLGRIKGQDMAGKPIGPGPSVKPEEEIPEWERRLMELETSGK
ncbi:MAG: hypothetical protein JSW54_05510 [Fidelibacterota bacterium]|nr:MAG: hypothetical protein JSW54_05510 [Candidatus Neomarinimicrobiota bacterium]